MSRTSYFSKFASSTTCHGFQNIAAANSVLTRSLWCICLLCSCTGMFVVMAQIIRDFINSPTATSIRTEQLKEMPFPDILVCPFEILNKSNLINHNISLELVNYIFTHGYQENRTFDLERAYAEVMSQFDNHDVRKFWEFFSPECEEIFAKISFTRDPIDCSKVRKLYLGHYGQVCFLFENLGKQLYGNYGLRMRINIDKSRYVSPPRDGEPEDFQGIFLQIHQPGNFNPVSFERIFIPAELASFLSLTVKTTEHRNTFLKTFCNASEKAYTLSVS